MSELHFRGTGVAASGEFVEITLGPDDDPNDFAVSVYRNDGSLHTAAGITGGEVNLGTLTGIAHPDNPAYTVYVISVGVRNAASDANEGSGIALTNVDTNTVLTFYSADNIAAFTATAGAASGATSQNILEHTDVAIGESYQWDIFGNLTFGTIDSGDSVLCLAGDALVATSQGDICAQDLVVGNLVWTVDHGFQPIRWIGLTTLTPEYLMQHHNQHPIRIAAGSLAAGHPAADLTLSRQHRVLIASPVAKRMIGAGEVLVPAAKLLACEGVNVITPTAGVTYVHILFDSHELISANGAYVESLLLTSYVQMIASGSGAIADCGGMPKAARPIVDGKKAKQLLARIAKNRRPLFEPQTAARA